MTKMNPGRELDAIIAEKVMGQKVMLLTKEQFCVLFSTFYTDSYPEFGYIVGAGKSLPHYSTDIAAAWLVVEKMRLLGFSYCIEQAISEEKPTAWFVPKSYGAGIHVLEQIAEAISEKSDSLPHAICLAALKAVGVEL